VSLLSDTEVQSLKEDVTEIKSDVKEIHCVLGDLRVLIAGNYVTKREFDNHKKDETNTRRWWAGYVVTAAGLVMAIITYFKN
jgi:hypothetical protein